MSKILVLANNDVGLYKFRKELLIELINTGNKVYISLPYGEYIENLKELGCIFIDTDIDRRGINPITDLKLFIKYLFIIKKFKPDLVITYTIKPNIYGGIVSRICNINYAINITGLGTAFQRRNLLRKVIILLYKMSCKKSISVFFENEENREVFLSHKIVSKNRTHKLNGAGVNLAEYSFCDYPDDGKEIRFLFIGRIMREKGVDELFETAGRLKKEYDNITFDILGLMEDNYEDVVEELSNQEIINYHSFQKDIRPFVINAHCFILPSYHEGMANTLLECGAMGRPLITSNIPGCREAVINEKSGYLIKIMDSEDLYDKVRMFIEQPYEVKKNMGIQSYIHICNIFDKKKVIENTLSELGIKR
jgi:galacturonosyltransferase